MAATEGKVHLAIVDIDELSDLALEGGVQAVPTVIAYKNGKVRLTNDSHYFLAKLIIVFCFSQSIASLVWLMRTVWTPSFRNFYKVDIEIHS